MPAVVYIALLDWTAIATLITDIYGPLSSSDMDAMMRDWLLWAITNDEAGEDWPHTYHRSTVSLATAIS